MYADIFHSVWYLIMIEQYVDKLQYSAASKECSECSPNSVYVHVYLILIIFSGPTYPCHNVHINTRSGKKMFHTRSMTSLCSIV